ncbi:hypothetical protein PMAYCL1PPCAC_20627, partial [Pristionchus mayeri]
LPLLLLLIASIQGWKFEIQNHKITPITVKVGINSQDSYIVIPARVDIAQPSTWVKTNLGVDDVAAAIFENLVADVRKSATLANHMDLSAGYDTILNPNLTRSVMSMLVAPYVNGDSGIICNYFQLYQCTSIPDENSAVIKVIQVPYNRTGRYVVQFSDQQA